MRSVHVKFQKLDVDGVSFEKNISQETVRTVLDDEHEAQQEATKFLKQKYGKIKLVSIM